MIGIVEYGMGNLRSVEIGLRRAGAEAKLICRPEELEQCAGVVLPGVGAFGQGMENLRRQGLVEPLRRWAAGDKPFLGICLGLQLLFEQSEESENTPGLGAIAGRVVRFSSVDKVPHMGWNSVEHGPAAQTSPYAPALPHGEYFYFVHSYYVVPEDEAVVLGTTEYGTRFASAIGRGLLVATQFHPEKSGEVGLEFLKRFVAIAEGEKC